MENLIYRELSFILPLFNAERFVAETIKSLLNQSFEDFNLFIVDDGSTDHSYEIVKSFKDKRINLFSIEHSGIIRAFNFVLSKIESKYIARVDADDIYYKDKILKQIKYLESNPESILVGTDAYYMAESGSTSKLKINVPADHNTIIENLYNKRRGMIQSTIVARTKPIKDIGGYREDIYPEDYDLFFRLSKLGKISNISEPLAAIRIHKSYSHRNIKALIKNHTKLASSYEASNSERNLIKRIKEMFTSAGIYLNRFGLYHYLNGSKLISFILFSISTIFSPLHTIKAVKTKLFS